MIPPWRTLVVAIDGTHHRTAEGAEAYAERFDAVLPFHAPGLAPVRRGAEAWHVRLDGSAAYPRRFRQTFGFYEGLAAVEDKSGFCHINEAGDPIYPQRYAWCGNVQAARVPVRRHDGRYLHLSAEGAAIASSTWRYAGDFREGSAVVQRDDGLHSHVGHDGGLLHDRWFLDLDVFHKGLARARDGQGWTHVDRMGEPISSARFAMVEPFYNGQARVERLSGALEVISLSGETSVVLRGPRVSPLHALSADLVGHWRTDLLAAAAHLDVPAALPGETAQVAAFCGLSLDAALRILRGLWEIGAVEPIAGVWTSTEKGALLAKGHPTSLAEAAIEYGGPLRDAWRRLPEVLRAAFRPAGEVFREVASDPNRLRAHHRMLSAYAEEDHAPWVERLPIEPGAVVLDAGGGTGALARRIAAHIPSAEVVLLDLPEVAREASGPFRAIGGDFFEPWPVEADVVVLARVLHDWDDPRAASLLTRARAALRPGGRLCILEMVLRDDDPRGSLCDLHVLAVTGGRERTVAAWRSLLASAGFTKVSLTSGPGIVTLLVAREP